MVGTPCKSFYLNHMDCMVHSLYGPYDMVFVKVLLFNLRKLKEMVLHHACCITCATIAVYTGTYSGYAMVGLSMEVNSIFLHAR